MKLLFDFFPLILFFVAFKVSDIFVATAVAIAATVAQIGWVLVRRRKVSNMQWISLAIIVIFGGATLVLRDETFIKWKPTVLYGITGVAFLAALAFKTNFAKAVMGEGIELPEPVWTRLAVAWGVFFLFQGALNLWVAFNFPLDDKQQDQDGKVECIPVDQAPSGLLKTALKATSLIGKSLYGVDMKEVDGKYYVIEINDNPNIDSGTEDKILKDKLYSTIMDVLLNKIKSDK